MRFAYADPPYLGMCGRYEHDHRDGCWDEVATHQRLIERLDGYDGWALSLHVPSLRAILALCPEDVRVMAWCKTWASWKPGVYPAAAWEPVILRGARKRRWANGDPQTPRDWFACSAAQTGFFGAKPQAMAYWLFGCLGIQPDDEFHDVFPGSGAVQRAWESWRAQLPLGLTG
jgi:hypothetical protein